MMRSSNETEVTMDFPSLVAANLATGRRPERMDARAEDQYYRSQISLPPRLRLLVPIATSAGLFLLLLVVPQI